MCRAEQFYQAARTLDAGCIKLGFLFAVPVDLMVCLSCGFVGPCVDHDGLAAIRQQATEAGERALREAVPA
jgi:hypothetical protein